MKTNDQMINLLEQYQYGCQHHFKNIYKAIKGISISSKDYYTFTRNYFTSTHVNSFKQPDIDSYPILKNQELISLTKKTFKCSNHHARIQSSKTKANTTIQSSFLITHTNYVKQRPVSNKISHVVTDPNKLKIKNLLMDLIFNEPSYDKMKYDETKIFYHHEEYLAYINDKVEELKSVRCSNPLSEVHRYFNDDHVYLQCKSIVLEFRNISDKGKKPITFKLPFAYLPLFYYKDFENVKYILLALINFNNKYTEITLDEEAIYHLLKTSVEYITTAPIKIQGNKICNSRQKITDDDLDYNSNHYHNTETKVNAPRIQIRDNSNDPPNTSSGLSSRYNAYFYYWITPVNTYQLEIKIPQITMVFPNLKKEINKTIDNELLFFLLVNNFRNWDFYIVNYLLSLKAFRWIIQSTISKLFKFSYKENNIIKKKASDEIMKHISIKTVNGIDYYSLSKKKIKAFIEKEKEFSFLQTDEVQNNHLVNLHNYQVTINNPSMLSNKEFIFSFNFKQMRQLNAVSHWQFLSSFLNKIVIVDMKNDTIRLNYDIFNYLNIDEILKYDKIVSTAKRSKIKEINLNISILYPYLEKIDFLRELNVQATSIISDTNKTVHRVLSSEILEEICNNQICNWPSILSNFNGNKNPKTFTMQMNREVNNKEKTYSTSKINTNKRYTYDKSMLL